MVGKGDMVMPFSLVLNTTREILSAGLSDCSGTDGHHDEIGHMGIGHIQLGAVDDNIIAI